MVCHSIIGIHSCPTPGFPDDVELGRDKISESTPMNFLNLSCRYFSLNLTSIPVTVISIAVIVMSTLVRFMTTISGYVGTEFGTLIRRIPL
ncbi:hypothetical protein P167DRAFT_320739 [Morchella conica CCBAS932]|uniref:Uncharacterized protein n=1 Tax=Morchella conica CCBAS932 TaxID=1392247 RepID=A0A3N4KF86_9PEZI|nr:hypothetical protein P167DRAFT_320739 [Morchella conica CCBAS932]